MLSDLVVPISKPSGPRMRAGGQGGDWGDGTGPRLSLNWLIRWPKYWSFSFSISPSSEHSGLISSRIDWFVEEKKE